MVRLPAVSRIAWARSANASARAGAPSTRARRAVARASAKSVALAAARCSAARASWASSLVIDIAAPGAMRASSSPKCSMRSRASCRRCSRSATARDTASWAFRGSREARSSVSYSRLTSGLSRAFSPWSQNAFSIARRFWGIGVPASSRRLRSAASRMASSPASGGMPNQS